MKEENASGHQLHLTDTEEGPGLSKMIETEEAQMKVRDTPKAGAYKESAVECNATNNKRSVQQHGRCAELR